MSIFIPAAQSRLVNYRNNSKRITASNNGNSSIQLGYLLKSKCDVCSIETG